jgi:hypothetical protein
MTAVSDIDCAVASKSPLCSFLCFMLSRCTQVSYTHQQLHLQPCQCAGLPVLLLNLTLLLVPAMLLAGKPLLVP